jgi:hypothetical protein
VCLQDCCGCLSMDFTTIKEFLNLLQNTTWFYYIFL